MTLPRTPDVLVVGGGVIGCAVARELAGEGLRVLLADRGPIGGEASSAAAGVLAVASGTDEGERLALRRTSRAAFPALVAALAEETGIDVELESSGVLSVALAEADVAAERERVRCRATQGLRAEWLDAETVRRREPAVTPQALGAGFYPDDAHLSGERLVAALAASARARGVVVVAGTPVHALDDDGRRARVGGEWIEPGVVVDAAGAWVGRIAGLDPGVAVTPVRGQMLALRPARGLCRAIVTAGDGFLVPRRRGELWVGATFEEAGFAREVTGEGVATLLDHARRLVPAAVEAPVVRAWAGLRPRVRDGGPAGGPAGGPVVGRLPACPRVVVAVGHYRNGILLAPVTAAAVSAIVRGVDVPEVVRPFEPAPY